MECVAAASRADRREEEDLDSDLNRYHEQLYEEEDLLHKEPEGGVGVGAGGLPPTVL